MKKIVVGILAHVDAGKTTLAEGMLYISGSIESLGRVEEKNTFLDHADLERSRGITIFSKQARMVKGDKEVILLDTPGHVEFSAEMERTLQVLDCGILVLNGLDGIQGHTRTLWSLLASHKIPTFLFVNKMDCQRVNQEELKREMLENFGEGCVEFEGDLPKDLEEVALLEESLLEKFLKTEKLSKESIREMIHQRKLFPCYFGSALRLERIEDLIHGLCGYGKQEANPEREEGFRGKVFKITRDEKGNRFTHLKVLSGVLSVRERLSYYDLEAKKIEEKVTQIRLYSGEDYTTVSRVEVGEICTLLGLKSTYVGMELGGGEKEGQSPTTSMARYQVVLKKEENWFEVRKAFSLMEEEEPALCVSWREEDKQLHVSLRGEIQGEVLRDLMKKRFQLDLEFIEEGTLYQESLQKSVIGRGHFESKNGYAELHFKMEPLAVGSGIVVENQCKKDGLKEEWQDYVIGLCQNLELPGDKVGGRMTDMKIALVNGRQKDGVSKEEDFYQGTIRGLRQGIKKSGTFLLEPYCEVELRLPIEQVGKGTSDLERRGVELEPLEWREAFGVLKGKGPRNNLRGYEREVVSYTEGRGTCFLKEIGYGPCLKEEEALEEERDMSWVEEEFPSTSIFFENGACISVEAEEADSYMDVQEEVKRESGPRRKEKELEEELEEIFLRTYGRQERKKRKEKKVVFEKQERVRKQEWEILLVDGYNVIFASEELKTLANEDIGAARGKLLYLLSDFQGDRVGELIVVFDAYRVEGGSLSVEKYHNIHVIYTKEMETADTYIEKTVHQIGRKYRVVVVTSDYMEQVIALGQGGQTKSSREFLEEVEEKKKKREEWLKEQRNTEKSYLFDGLEEPLRERAEDVRLGRKSEM